MERSLAEKSGGAGDVPPESCLAPRTAKILRASPVRADIGDWTKSGMGGIEAARLHPSAGGLGPGESLSSWGAGTDPLRLRAGRFLADIQIAFHPRNMTLPGSRTRMSWFEVQKSELLVHTGGAGQAPGSCALPQARSRGRRVHGGYSSQVGNPWMRTLPSHYNPMGRESGKLALRSRSARHAAELSKDFRWGNWPPLLEVPSR